VDETEPVEQIRRFIACISDSAGTILGTGVFLGPTRVLTCRHVVEVDGQVRAPADLRLTFFGRNSDPRVAVRIDCTAGERSYASDVAVVEIDEPFRAGEIAPHWVTDFPPVGQTVVFAGYRQKSRNQVDPELVSTKTIFYDHARTCYMLRDECTQGFSGGPVTYQIDGRWYVVGIVVANLRHRPSRTWCLPAGAARRAVEATGLSPELISLSRSASSATRQSGLRYLVGLSERHNPVRYFIDLGAARIFPDPYSVPSAADQIVRIIADSKSATQRAFFFGNYGSGKTCVAIEAAIRALETAATGPPGAKIPIFVELRDWKAMPSWNDLARYIAESDRYPIRSMAEVLELARQDSLFFLFDGLDEIAGSLTVQGSVALVQDIPRSVYDGASFIAFSRFSFILDERSLMEMLQDSEYALPEILQASLSASSYRAYSIIPPSESDIRAYLTAVCGEDAPFALRLVDDVYDLADLARRPVLLAMIARCVPALRHQRDDLLKLASPVKSVDLYNAYVSQWLRNPKHRSRLTYVQRRHTIEDLAVYMWHRKTMRVPHDELASFLESRLPDGTPSALLYDIGNCSFLDLVTQGYEFSHKSFLEYFVASAICRDLFEEGRTGFDSELLAGCMREAPSQNEVTAFLRDLVVRRLEAQPTALATLIRYFASPFADDRAWAGYLLGHASAEFGNADILTELEAAYTAEDDPWVKRSLAVACGRAGRPDIVQHYAAALLPSPEHRLTNLRYHLEYYGSLRRVVEAVVSHVLSGGHNFLQPIDLFTLRQVMAAEPPLGPRDEALAKALTALLGPTGTDQQFEQSIRAAGLRSILHAFDTAVGQANPLAG
jgi:hypothetical protein